ncbi:MAG: hypothetical protein JWP06_205 [Candidatus Saccharibacteria bacterium]|nr:hypothetical protein [Candidatus Saccharibacteria bacterium]
MRTLRQRADILDVISSVALRTSNKSFNIGARSFGDSHNDLPLGELLEHMEMLLNFGIAADIKGVRGSYDSWSMHFKFMSLDQGKLDKARKDVTRQIRKLRKSQEIAADVRSPAWRTTSRFTTWIFTTARGIASFLGFIGIILTWQYWPVIGRFIRAVFFKSL